MPTLTEFTGFQFQFPLPHLNWGEVGLALQRNQPSLIELPTFL